MSSGHGWCNVAAFPEAERAHAGAAMETCHTADGINLATLAVAEMRMPAPGRNHVPGVHAEMPVSYMQQIQMRKHLARARPPTRLLWQGAGPINNLQKNGASTPK